MEIGAFLCRFLKKLLYKVLEDKSTHGLVILFFLSTLPVQLFCSKYPHVAAETSGSKPCKPHSSPGKCGQVCDLWPGLVSTENGRPGKELRVTCPPPVLKPSQCVIKCFYSSRKSFFRAFLCQILCGADAADVQALKGRPWEVHSSERLIPAGQSCTVSSPCPGMQDQLSLWVHLELIKPLGKEAQAGCTWWMSSAWSVVGG